MDLKIKSNMVSDLFSLVGMLLFVYLLIGLFIKQTETSCREDRQACAVMLPSRVIFRCLLGELLPNFGKSPQFQKSV